MRKTVPRMGRLEHDNLAAGLQRHSVCLLEGCGKRRSYGALAQAQGFRRGTSPFWNRPETGFPLQLTFIGEMARTKHLDGADRSLCWLSLGTTRSLGRVPRHRLQRLAKVTGRQISNFRRPVIAEFALPQSRLLNGVLVVIRVAVTTPVTPKVGFPLMSYAWNVNLPE